jgi:hypothetical protein
VAEQVEETTFKCFRVDQGNINRLPYIEHRVIHCDVFKHKQIVCNS